MFRFFCILAIVAVANAGVANYNGLGAVIAPTVTSEQQNVLRSYGNLGQVSYNSKTIDTPYSSVSKSDVRVSNPGYATYAAQPIAYAQPAVYHAPAQPAVYHAPAQPAVYHAPAQVSSYHAPAQVASYHAPNPVAYAAAPVHYSQPAVVAAPQKTLLGVAYSPATAVSHMTYSAPVYSYSW